MPTAFRDQLTASVSDEGRDVYRGTLDAIPEVVGREGRIAALKIRVIKGINQLDLQRAMLTENGLATPDGAITDCSAAMVRWKKDHWERYSGKDTAHSTRLFSTYDAVRQKFTIAAAGKQSQSFPASVLHPRDGEIVTVKFGNGGFLDGVLENGPLTDHIRQSLSEFESEVENLGVLLRHPSFLRPSDTRTVPQTGVNTLYSDGSQMHAMNKRTILEWQNATISRQMTMASYRAGLEIDGDEMPPNIEDLIYEIRVRTQEGTDVPLYLASLTPRCPVTQRDTETGAMNAEPKSWNRKHRPLRPWDQNATMGANVDTAPSSAGSIISVDDRFTVESEKQDWLK